jgi:hypothetical protein
MKKMAEFYNVKIMKHIYAFNEICNPWSDVLYLGIRNEGLITFKRSILVQVNTKIWSINEISPEQSIEIIISLKLGLQMDFSYVIIKQVMLADGLARITLGFKYI